MGTGGRGGGAQGAVVRAARRAAALGRRSRWWTVSAWRFLAACLALPLAGCLVWSAGRDPQGQALMQNAVTVQAALNAYIHDHRRGPPSLQDLVPRYLAALPAQPELNYSARRGSLVFNYQPSWPEPGVSACEARFGETAFRCVDYR